MVFFDAETERIREELGYDGEENTVVEVDSVAEPISDHNPYGLALSTQSTITESESQSARDFMWESQRAWKLINPDKRNRHGGKYRLQTRARVRRFHRCWTPHRRSASERRSSATRSG